MRKTKTDNTIEITEDIRVPGTDVILEAGDRIKVLESQKKYRVARKGGLRLDGGDVDFGSSNYSASKTASELYRDSGLIKEINNEWIRDLTRQVDTPPVSSVNSPRDLEVLFKFMNDEESFSFVDFDAMTAKDYRTALADYNAYNREDGGGWGFTY